MNKTGASIHRTVLLQETIDGLNLGKNAVVVDGTFGGGGHSWEICHRFPDVKIIAFDQDADTFSAKGGPASGWKKCNISFHNENFRNLDKVLKKEGIDKVDGIIFDLGLSSDQLENSGRGFSFLKDEPLLMQMKNRAEDGPAEEDPTAADIVNTWSEKSLADIIYGYGEEKFSRRIAKGIVRARERERIKTTFDLVKVIEDAVPAVYRRSRLHYATKTFQALRIAVNDELGALKEGLEKGFEVLKVGGRIGVISFHSLEDRIVKKFYKEKEKDSLGKSIYKKPVTAGDEEILQNNRARSAKLRILEKIQKNI